MRPFMLPPHLTQSKSSIEQFCSSRPAGAGGDYADAICGAGSQSQQLHALAKFCRHSDKDMSDPAWAALCSKEGALAKDTSKDGTAAKCVMKAYAGLPVGADGLQHALIQCGIPSVPHDGGSVTIQKVDPQEQAKQAQLAIQKMIHRNLPFGFRAGGQDYQ